MGRVDRRYNQKEKQLHMKKWLLVGKAMEVARDKAYANLEDSNSAPGFNLDKPELILPNIFYINLINDPESLNTQAVAEAISKTFTEYVDSKIISLDSCYILNNGLTEILGLIVIPEKTSKLGALYTMASMHNPSESNKALAKIAINTLTNRKTYESFVNAVSGVDDGPDVNETVELSILVHWMDRLTNGAYSSALKINKEIYEFTKQYFDACSDWETMQSAACYKRTFSNLENEVCKLANNQFRYLNGEISDLDFVLYCLRLQDANIETEYDSSKITEGESQSISKYVSELTQLMKFDRNKSDEEILHEHLLATTLVTLHLPLVLAADYGFASGAFTNRISIQQYEREIKKVQDKLDSSTESCRKALKERNSLKKQLESALGEVKQLREKAAKLDQSNLNLQLLKMAKESAERENELLAKIADVQSRYDSEHKKRRDIELKAREVAGIAAKQKEKILYLEDEQAQLETRENTIDMGIPIDIVVNYVRNQRLVIVGGTQELATSLKNLGLQFKQYTFNRKIEMGAVKACDCVVIMTSNVKHPTFFSYRDTAKNLGKKVVYSKSQNTELLCRAIYHEMVCKG